MPSARTRLRKLLLLTSLIAVATGAFVPANAAAAPLFGFNDMLASWGQVDQNQNATLAKNAGATSSLITVNWRAVEPTKGDLRWQYPDAAYNAAVAKAQRPIMSLIFSPAWTWDEGVECSVDCRYPPAAEHYADYKAFVAAVVKRYPKAAGIQIWNEPNLGRFWQGGVDPVRYTNLVKQAYRAVRSVSATMPVGAGALTNYGGTDTSAYMPQRDFLKAMYAAGLKGNANAITLHPYPDDIDMWAFNKAMTEVREVRDAAGDTTAKLWITEIGVSSNDPANRSYVFNENDQAVMNGRLVQRLKVMPDVTAIMVHTLGAPILPDGSEDGYAVARRDLTPKPAFCEIAKVNASAYRCPTSVATVKPADTAQASRWQAQDLLQTAADAARTYRKTYGSYTGITSAAINRISTQISATPADPALIPGTAARPERVGVWTAGSGADQSLLICNTSKADRSYCIYTVHGSFWRYGKAESNIYAAAGATTSNASSWW